MVAKDWKSVTLKELLDGPIKNGYSPNATDSETGYWVLGLGALGDEGINSSEIKPVLPEERVLQNILRTDDFLVSRSNTPDKVGRSIRFRNEIENCSYPDLMMRFRIDENKADKAFIEHQLKSAAVRTYFKNCAAGSSSTMVKINKGILEKTPLVVPPVKEQKKIAQILSTWDKAISVTEKLLVNSQKQKKALMQQLLTGKKRLLDENGVRFIGEWYICPLSEVAHIIMGSSPKSEAYNDNGVGLPLIQGNADIKCRVSCPRVYTSDITKECSPGDILLSVRAPVGTVALSQHKACIGRGISAIKSKRKMSQSFLYQWFLWFEPKWCSLSQGSTFESINSDDIKTLKLSVPNLEEQQKIAAVLSAADTEISILEKKLACLKEEKKALMQQLLTGKRRVKVEVEETVSA
ncbi:TPA: restriction endonuclease subunit S [Escherichia coli]|uniref:restriction endonuclease subunit S n=1 Tax=Escherichia TaxID=561 RepID=UPI000CF7A655|nr:restriction endonuclease subunit S [Escherichia sp. MOD1-EC5427]MEC9534464.1 restriction endonuclease subunit S [Escherichia marmotae]HAI3445663.1 restriction endonuclease subunit S [Escherichia coli]MEC9851772.1 restriction endonuclease subunit S [Escherichia marmotae]MEC9929392.1 restriction endonuclease subunit S [Escherichia marmotae]MEC9979325.1 restriction endonuclease subunit S [Escherichia marmotae]